MNKKTLFWGWLSLSVIRPEGALSGQFFTVQVELDSSSTAASHILYKNGVQVCFSTIHNATTVNCNIEIDAAPMTFVLTSVDADGVEKLQAAPFILTPPLDPASGNYIPKANFAAKATSAITPLPVSFDASCASDLDGMIVDYVWYFGDGGGGTGKLIDYTFAAPGTYAVTLAVLDEQGAADEMTTSITVGNQTPERSSMAVPGNTDSLLLECQNQIIMAVVDRPKLDNAKLAPVIFAIRRK